MIWLERSTWSQSQAGACGPVSRKILSLFASFGVWHTSNNPICHYASQPARLNNNWLPQCRLFRGEEAKDIDGRTLGELLCSKADEVQSQFLSCVLLRSWDIPATLIFLFCDCVKRAPLLLLRSQVALSFKVCQPVSLWGISVTWSDLHFFAIYKGINALYLPSIINYQLLPPHSVLYWPRHSFIIS